MIGGVLMMFGALFVYFGLSGKNADGLAPWANLLIGVVLLLLGLRLGRTRRRQVRDNPDNTVPPDSVTMRTGRSVADDEERRRYR